MTEMLLIKTDKKLSKSQDTFNKLVKRIEKRKKDIERLGNALKTYFIKRTETIGELCKERMEWQVKYAHLLDDAFENNKFSKSDKQKLVQMILNVCKAYDERETQYPDLLSIEVKYNQHQFSQLSDEEKAVNKEMLQQYMQETFGVDIDLSEDGDDFNFFNLREKFEEKFKEKIDEAIEDDKADAAFRKNNKHVGGYTAKSKSYAEQLNKSWKKIYIQLVKALHPDTEQDETLKTEKDALMKEVTAAYENNNFYKLLQLHIQHGNTGNMPEYFENEDILKQYTKILKDQDAVLKDELDALQEEMFAYNLSFLQNKYSNAHVHAHLVKETLAIQKNIEIIKRDITDLSDIDKLKKELKELTLEDLLPRNDLFDIDLSDFFSSK